MVLMQPFSYAKFQLLNIQIIIRVRDIKEKYVINVSKSQFALEILYPI